MQTPLETEVQVATGDPVATSFRAWYPAGVPLLLWASLLGPLILFTDFFFPYVTTRALFFRAIVEVAFAALLYSLLRSRRPLLVRRDPIFLALFALVLINALSALLSQAPIRSFYGNFERMGGAWAWIHWLLYYAILRTVLDGRGWLIFFRIGTAVSVVVSLLGIRDAHAFAVRYPGQPIPHMASTIGNSGLLAAFLVFGVAFSLLLAFRRDRFRFAYVAAAGLNLTSIVLSQNRSTVLGIVLGILGGGILYIATAKPARRSPGAYSVFAVVTGVISVVLLARLAPQASVSRALPAVFARTAQTRFDGGDALRLMQWQTAFRGFREHPLLGVGPENHSLVWEKYFQPGALHFDRIAIYDRPHNAFIEALEATGLLGFAAFLGIWVAVGLALRRGWRNGAIPVAELSLIVGVQIAYAVFLFFWFTDVNSTPLWIALCAYVASRERSAQLLVPDTTRTPSPLVMTGYGLGLAGVCAALFFHILEPLRVAHALDTAQNPGLPLRAGLEAAETSFDSRGPQKSHAVLVFGSYLASLTPRFATLRASPSDSPIANRIFEKVIVGSSREVNRDPFDDRLRVEYARILLMAGQYYRDTRYSRAAIAQIQRSIELNPNRVNSRIILANIIAGMGDYDRAISTMRAALRIDPTLGEAHYELARLFFSAGNADSAIAALDRSFTLGFAGAPEGYIVLAGKFEQSGHLLAAAATYARYLEERFGKAIWSGSLRPRPETTSGDLWIAGRLPLVYLKLRDNVAATRSANALLSLDPRYGGTVAGFKSSLAAGETRAWIAQASLTGCPTADFPEAGKTSLPECFPPAASSSAPGPIR